MNYSKVSIKTYFLLLLLFISVLMGLGIIVPGYLKIREFEALEASSYTLDRSIRMRDKIDYRVEVLRKAGVSEIPSYVEESKRDMLREIAELKPDPRMERLILDEHGAKIFESSANIPPEIKSSLLAQIDGAEYTTSLHLQGQGQEWVVSFEKQEEWGWYIFAMMNEQAIYLNSKRYLLYVLGVSAFLVLMILGLSILLTYRLRRRAGSVLQLIRQYGDGEYEERLQVTGPAELVDLQEGINSMIDNIEMEILSRKTIEEALNSARLEAEDINHAKAEYVRDMGHQSQNAMNNVRGFSALLLKTDLDEQQRKYANNVLSASQSLSSMASDMLALSGIEVQPNPDGPIDYEAQDNLLPLMENIEVLLVGVDSLNCAYLTEILSAQGVIPIAVHDEAAAVKYLEEEDADLIILDIDRTKLSGEDSIKYLRSNLTAYASSIPILLTTSNADALTMCRYRRTGATNCLRKPYSATRLLAILDEIIRVEEVESSEDQPGLSSEEQ